MVPRSLVREARKRPDSRKQDWPGRASVARSTVRRMVERLVRAAGFDLRVARYRRVPRQPRAGGMLNLAMRLGEIEPAFSPTGPRDFADLKRDVVPLAAAGVTFLFASLADIRSRAAAHREKERRTLPRLGALPERTTGEDRAASLDDGARRASGERCRD